MADLISEKAWPFAGKKKKKVVELDVTNFKPFLLSLAVTSVEDALIVQNFVKKGIKASSSGSFPSTLQAKELAILRNLEKSIDEHLKQFSV